MTNPLPFLLLSPFFLFWWRYSIIWIVLDPGAAHISKHLCVGFIPNKVTGTILTFSCLNMRPFSVSSTRNLWNYLQAAAFLISTLPTLSNEYTSPFGYHGTGYGILSFRNGSEDIRSMYCKRYFLVSSKFTSIEFSLKQTSNGSRNLLKNWSHSFSSKIWSAL